MTDPQPQPSPPDPLARTWRRVGCGGMALGALGALVGALLVLPSLGTGVALVLAGGGPDSTDTLAEIRVGSALVYGSGMLFVLGLIALAVSYQFRPVEEP